MNRITTFFLILSMLLAGNVLGQHASVSGNIEFVQNNGQWQRDIKFEASLPGGQLYLESSKMTFVFYHQEDIGRIHELKHHTKDYTEGQELNIRGHRFELSFVDAKPLNFEGRKVVSNYYNYFLGNDKKHWASEVPAYQENYVKDLWPGIDYRLYSQNVDMKYDFIIKAGADPGDIQLRYDHLQKISLRNGNLHLRTSVNELIDLRPVAYQKINDKLVFVPCEFSLKKSIVSFTFPEGYDQKLPLILDPKLIFSSYSGSTLDNWGYTATFDQAGNLYAAGAVFSSTNTSLSYPTTSGAFQTSFDAGRTDIGISKFKSDGTSLIYSTYLGGSRNELPHSLVVSPSNELVVMGTSSSVDFPVTSNAYDTTYNISGTATKTVSVIVTYLGSDIILTKFSPSGGSLIGSTYVGGSGFDGINVNNLEFNYGDDVRGEVIIDPSGNIMVASTTESTNFPVTNFSSHGGGTQDAVVFQLDSALTSLKWAAYLGGNNNDAAYSLQVDKSGRTYVAGGTRSTNFPTTNSAIHPTYIGGIDGFVTAVNPLGFGLSASTRLGTSSYDQAYFVQLDDSGYVYVTGQTEGGYPVTPASVYRNANSGQFIHKLGSSLDTTIFSTVVGTGGSSSNIDVDISPSAFLVNQCDHIYLAGWGGNVNSANSQATASTTTGLPTTSGAFKTTTDGNDFYLIVLDRNGDSLLYATFFGGSSTGSGEHVDGGTSRFDKRGIVYQAVCAGCGGNNSFPTSPSNVWSSQNGSSNCNLGVIKFDLSQLTSDIGLDALTKVCIPGTVTFQNNSNGGTNYFWDFGDGDTSIAFQPTHTYLDTGNYTVMLIVSDSLSCLLTDTAYITIRGESPPVADIMPIPVLCPGDSVQLMASGGSVYKWLPATFLSNDTIPNPFAYPNGNTTYTVIVGDSCGSDTANYFAYDTATIDVILAADLSSASSDDTICKGQSIQLNSAGGISYQWTPTNALSNSSVPNPFANPTQTTTYSVVITDQYGCEWNHSVVIHVEDPQNPRVLISPDTSICLGDSLTLFALGASHYLWRPFDLVVDSSSNITMAFPNKTTDFTVDVFGKCFSYTDTVRVEVIDYQVLAMPDTFACEDVPIQLTAEPGVSFRWTPSNLLNDPQSNMPFAEIKEPVQFIVYGIDQNGCESTDSLFVDLREAPYVSAGNDRLIRGNTVLLEGRGNGRFSWEPKALIDCPNCKFTEAFVPGPSQLFRLKIVDEFGCVNSDQVLISKLTDELYVPNSFTPNSDTKNEVFKASGFNVENFYLTIYDRWGEVVFVSSDIEKGWDGSFKGAPAMSGNYVWVITYKSGEEQKERKGSVLLLK
ncbi:MAG: gliding motility-associated C-terminal domain-containing protein [Vicingaceae bacterium]